MPQRLRRTRLGAQEDASDRRAYEAWKRAFDLVVSLLALVLALPLMMLLVVLVRLDSPGPAIFRQRRIARGGGTFAFYKFRTMWIDSRERFPELYAFRYAPEELPNVTLSFPDDPRLTGLGRFLRRSSLDELPNLVNVVRGEMSLVGPRPELPAVLQYYTPPQLEKFAVLPGVTGLAQISGRGLLRFHETIAADLEYCRRRSFRHDLSILVKTVGSIIRSDGAF